jgi:hypothetical protein
MNMSRLGPKDMKNLDGVKDGPRDARKSKSIWM